ncbi:MAG: hypothetical protein N2692_02570 [Patescibacteria group bacterium]|jgi:uncharacterized protein YoxC|nr:hypothetical protein [Patescibacteria group bacterium]
MDKKLIIWLIMIVAGIILWGVHSGAAQQQKNNQTPIHTPTNINIPVIQQIQEQNLIQVQSRGEETNIQQRTNEQNAINAASPTTSPSATPTPQARVNKPENPRSANARENMSIVAQRVEELLSATTTEITGIGQQVREIARQQKEVQQQIQEQFQNIDSRPAWLKYIFGPAYSSIEKIKQYLEQNQVRIQQLEQLMNQLTNEGEKQLIQQMINALNEQRTALQNYLNAEEKTSSLLGRILRFFFRKRAAAPSPTATPTTVPSPTPTE